MLVSKSKCGLEGLQEDEKVFYSPGWEWKLLCLTPLDGHRLAIAPPHFQPYQHRGR